MISLWFFTISASFSNAVKKFKIIFNKIKQSIVKSINLIGDCIISNDEPNTNGTIFLIKNIWSALKNI